jgi:mRNA interferase RelE/StbE
VLSGVVDQELVDSLLRNNATPSAMSGASYRVEITPNAQKQILPNKDRARVEAKIEALADNPRPMKSLKLSGMEDTYRIRVGNYRVIYKIRDQLLLVLVTDAVHRKDAY